MPTAKLPYKSAPDPSEWFTNQIRRLNPNGLGEGVCLDASLDSTEKPFAFRSSQMDSLLKKAVRYARSSAPILITGESGTGKELISRIVHRLSSRATKNFVAVNCAAMPELLVESELFGHERGAFTGAFQQRIGHFQFAHRGTILLDEITEIPLNTQSKLLRVIEEQEVLRLGSSQPERIDVRILATSNRDLEDEVKAGTFRLDLFFRLNVLQLRIPSLRQRSDDIPYLAEHFLERFRSESTRSIKGITKSAMEKLCQYDWPGNIRELRNVIQRACIECDSDYLDEDALPALPTGFSATDTAIFSLDEVEKKMILASLEKHQGNKSAAAADLGVTPRTLANKLKIYRSA